ncbi:MAG: GtrA family protein [Phenylobacterium sp.]|uniref:GtrA family protein n=1 Tax=Phenylobacterium sp. TaxID=1871053 RepID=UPI00121594AB|nr:GtrA family protein [Phenylobacterium sp.]TAJ71611.1 MAG: GtrA family protein [Phenylobacterium sp.]
MSREASAPLPPTSRAEKWRHSIALLIRFGIVGVLNTIVGYSVIAGLDLGLGVDSHLANAVGYVVGIVFSYFLQRSFVFASQRGHRQTVVSYAIAAGLAFLINQGVLAVALRVIGDLEWQRALAQLVAMASYSIAFFILMRLWVFRAEHPAA